MKKMFVSAEVAWQLNPLTLLPCLAYPDWLALKCVEKRMQLFIQPSSVFFLSMAFAYYICNCRTQLHRKAEDRPIYLCWSTCTRDFILISSWRCSQTDGRGSAEFIISISLSCPLFLCIPHTQMYSVSKLDALVFICIKITLFCFAIILSSWILTLFRLDPFQTTIRSPGVVHSPCFNLCSVLICVCKCSARWAVSSTRAQGQFGEWLSQQSAQASQHTLWIHQ